MTRSVPPFLSPISTSVLFNAQPAAFPVAQASRRRTVSVTATATVCFCCGHVVAVLLLLLWQSAYHPAILFHSRPGLTIGILGICACIGKYARGRA